MRLGRRLRSEPMGSCSIDRSDRAVPPRRVPGDRGLRRLAAVRRAEGRADEIVDDFQPSERAHDLHHQRAGAGQQRRVPRVRVRGVVLLRGGGVRRATASCARPKALSINKIGHAMHDLDPEFETFCYTPELAGVAADIGLADALPCRACTSSSSRSSAARSAAIRTRTFLYTDPMTVTGFWFAIEDATLENGCLWAEPGGHRTALRKLFKRAGDTDADGTMFEELDATPLPSPSELSRWRCRPARW